MLELILVFAAGIFFKEIVQLVFGMLVKWFRNRRALVASDRDNIAFTLQNKLKSGKYNTVQGVFNTRTNEVIDGHKMMSNEIDNTIDKYHRDEELVLYE